MVVQLELLTLGLSSGAGLLTVLFFEGCKWLEG